MPVPIITLTGNRLSPALFAGMLDFVKRKGCISVARLYKPGDVSYLKSMHSTYSWDLYPPAARLYNTRRLAIRVQAVYQKIVSANFPQIARQLAFIQPGHRLIYVYDSSQNLGGPNDPQGTDVYEIIADRATRSERPTFLYASEHTVETMFRDSKWILTIDNEAYELVRISRGVGADFWRSDTPLLDMIYKYLKRALDAYFKQGSHVEAGVVL